MAGLLTDDLVTLTMPDGSQLEFVEVAPHVSGDRQFRIKSRPPRRQVWNFRNLPHHAQVLVGAAPHLKTGGTGLKIRLRPVKPA